MVWPARVDVKISSWNLLDGYRLERLHLHIFWRCTGLKINLVAIPSGENNQTCRASQGICLYRLAA
jgi:hypothetical protein